MLLRHIKNIIKKFPVAFTRNQRYDRLTKKIIRKVCIADSNCIDAGTHRGEILDELLKSAPRGLHFGFEPIPFLFSILEKKYEGAANCKIYKIALSDKKGVASFNYVLTNPAYSGLKKRKYDRKNERDTILEVQTDLLDHLVPPDIKIAFIKIDVEGGEMAVLKGAQRILAESRPVIVFEFGIGGSDIYGSTPEKLFDFYLERNYRISLLQSFVNQKPHMEREEFKDQFYQKKNYYFVAYPKNYGQQ